MKDIILIKNNLVEVNCDVAKKQVPANLLGTVIANFAYYGFVPSKELFNRLSKISEKDIKDFWTNIEPVIKKITGADKNMAKYVVYKNFPKEVLDMTLGEYWIKQILMYWGLPNELFTESEKDRDLLFEKINLKVLHLANENSLKNICNSLLNLPARWTKEQLIFASYLIIKEEVECDIAKIPFKENFINIVKMIIKANARIKIKSATDILRLAVGMSDGDVSMRKPSKFRSFKRAERRFLLDNLETSSSLEEDMARDRNKWKKFMKMLHPGDYKTRCPRVVAANKKLCENNIITFNSRVESLFEDREDEALDLLQKRPGEFVRRLRQTMSIYGSDAVDKFIEIVPNLSMIQLLKISKYIETINDRDYRTFAPRGNWTKLQIVDNDIKIAKRNKERILSIVQKEISSRIEKRIKSVNLSKDVDMIKLQNNDSELTSYGRGTEFPIPENIKFIRSASYWQCKRSGCTWFDSDCTWFDNGWNFFDANWNPMGVCCWTNVRFSNMVNNRSLFGSYYYADEKPKKNEIVGAIFSGDPTNSKEMQGKACQMIDLYLDNLEKMGVRYAVWNILCYSRIPFGNAEDVFAAMQFGEEPQKGKLFEPSRCQLSFQIQGDSLTKYIAMIDVLERKVIYLDANFRGSTRSAGCNSESLQKIMPAYLEYLNAQPSVYDMFKNVKKDKNGVDIVYDDAEIEIDGEKAYVFKPVNENNKYEPLLVSELL